jgi:hypothetical protein
MEYNKAIQKQSSEKITLAHINVKKFAYNLQATMETSTKS